MRRTRLRPVGARHEREAEVTAASRVEAAKRAHGRCEGCGERGVLAWHHVLGRPATGLKLGHWAHHPALTAMLCGDDPRTGRQGCHSVAHGLGKRQRAGMPLGAYLEQMARARFEASHHGLLERVEARHKVDDWSTADIMRALVRELEGRE